VALKFSAQQGLAFNGHFLQAKWKTLVQPNQFLPPKAGLKTWLDRRYSQGEIKRLKKITKTRAWFVQRK